MGKELIGIVHTAYGSFKQYMPEVDDIALLDHRTRDFTWRLGAISIGIDYEQFRRWNVADALQVTSKLCDAMNKLSQLGKNKT